MDKLKQRLSKDRSASAVTIQLPDDVIGDLKQVAIHLGFSDYQALARAYIGQGLRVDLERLESTPDVADFESDLRI